jgi:hypothetical protein
MEYCLVGSSVQLKFSVINLLFTSGWFISATGGYELNGQPLSYILENSIGTIPCSRQQQLEEASRVQTIQTVEPYQPNLFCRPLR